MPKKKPKRMNKAGAVDAGKGKTRPHHKEVNKRTRQSLKDNPPLVGSSLKFNPDAYKERRKRQDANYIPRTPNKYQSQPKVISEDSTSKTYQWLPGVFGNSLCTVLAWQNRLCPRAVTAILGYY